MYRPEFFKLEELVPGSLFQAAQKKAQTQALWTLFHPDILKAADTLRQLFGPMECNTWSYGGPIHYRGFRYFNSPVLQDLVCTDFCEDESACETCSIELEAAKAGAFLSQHKFGRALDLMPIETSAKKIQDFLISLNRDSYAYNTEDLNLITAIELNTSWLHIDCRETNQKGLMLFKP